MRRRSWAAILMGGYLAVAVFGFNQMRGLDDTELQPRPSAAGRRTLAAEGVVPP